MTASPDVAGLRALTRGDLAAAHALSQAVGWPHRLEDWRLLHGLGDGLALEHGDALAGTALWWPFGPAVGTVGLASVGLVIVAPDRQGRGLGRRLMQAVLDRAGPGRVLRLNATPAGTPLYRALGFRDAGGVRQHQGVPRPGLPVSPHPDVRPLGPADREAVARLDRAATGLDRGAMLDRLLPLGTGAVLERDGRIAAYGLRRAFGRGEVVGPVAATGEAEALAVVQALAGAPVDRGRPPFLRAPFLRIDIPAGARIIAAWLDASGLPEVDAGVTMIRGTGGPEPEGAAAYGLVAQAIG